MIEREEDWVVTVRGAFRVYLTVPAGTDPDRLDELALDRLYDGHYGYSIQGDFCPDEGPFDAEGERCPGTTRPGGPSRPSRAPSAPADG